MLAPEEHLAQALEALHVAQRQGVVQAKALSRLHRERLLRQGFLQEVIRGWLIAAHPGLSEGQSTAWYAHLWAFVQQYLASRFRDDYCLSAEASLQRHAHSPTIPRQVTVMTCTGSNQVVPLPHATSLLLYKDVAHFPQNRIQQEALWLMDVPTALVRVAPAFFQTSPEDAQVALRSLHDLTPLLRALLDNGSTSAAGRLAGAYEALGNMQARERIVQAMRSAGLTSVRVSNPFTRALPVWEGGERALSPHAARLSSLWAAFRPEVARIVPPAPGLPANAAGYLAQVDERYVQDAYNSLSIEGYQVSPALIERVRQGGWNPQQVVEDHHQQDALAARGYFQAFQAVKESLRQVLSGAGAASIVGREHPLWYQELFAPAVQAGLLPPSSLAGYRNQAVYLRGSRHVPPGAEAVLDSLDALFDLLAEEPEPAVQAILGHFFFVYIHPYADGNGRLGRFLMNCLLAGGGYPWTVIRQSERKTYLDALEQASVERGIAPFARFICAEMVSGDRG